jgi:GNAT superfamily N-acetyltransferase
MADWVIEHLTRQHERGDFHCGTAALDDFLKTLASQYEKKGIGRTFVATRPGSKRVLGYYTAAAGSFALDALPEEVRKTLPRHPVPTLHLGRLAVDRTCKGERLGETLLMHFFQRAVELSHEFGIFAIDVWAKDDGARAFYLKYGFVPLRDAPLHLYLPLKTVAAMFDPP